MTRPTTFRFSSPRLLASIVFAAVAGAAGTQALAASPNGATPHERYKTDVEHCRTSPDVQDRKTCLRDAGAALQEAQRGTQTSAAANFDQNQQARCDRLSGTQRDDCMTLMSDPNANVQGSIAAGGVLRETTITEPADPAMPATGDTSLVPADQSVPPATSAPAGTMAPAGTVPPPPEDTGSYQPRGNQFQ